MIYSTTIIFKNHSAQKYHHHYNELFKTFQFKMSTATACSSWGSKLILHSWREGRGVDSKSFHIENQGQKSLLQL